MISEINSEPVVDSISDKIEFEYSVYVSSFSAIKSLEGIILENSSSVIKWLRPAPNQFNIYWNKENKYEPDFVVETNVHKMLSNMLSFYICYELKMYEKNCFAAENIKRSIITKLSLEKLKEEEEKQKAEDLRKRKELTILKTVENYKKTIYNEESR